MDKLVKLMGKYRQLSTRVGKSKKGRGTKIERTLEVLKEDIDDLINAEANDANLALNFIEYIADADRWSFNELDLCTKPYQTIRKIERITGGMAKGGDVAYEYDSTPEQAAKLKQLIAGLKSK